MSLLDLDWMTPPDEPDLDEFMAPLPPPNTPAWTQLLETLGRNPYCHVRACLNQPCEHQSAESLRKLCEGLHAKKTSKENYKRRALNHALMVLHREDPNEVCCLGQGILACREAHDLYKAAAMEGRIVDAIDMYEHSQPFLRNKREKEDAARWMAHKLSEAGAYKQDPLWPTILSASSFERKSLVEPFIPQEEWRAARLLEGMRDEGCDDFGAFLELVGKLEQNSYREFVCRRMRDLVETAPAAKTFSMQLSLFCAEEEPVICYALEKMPGCRAAQIMAGGPLATARQPMHALVARLCKLEEQISHKELQKLIAICHNAQMVPYYESIGRRGLQHLLALRGLPLGDSTTATPARLRQRLQDSDTTWVEYAPITPRNEENERLWRNRQRHIQQGSQLDPQAHPKDLYQKLLCAEVYYADEVGMSGQSLRNMAQALKIKMKHLTDEEINQSLDKFRGQRRETIEKTKEHAMLLRQEAGLKEDDEKYANATFLPDGTSLLRLEYNTMAKEDLLSMARRRGLNAIPDKPAALRKRLHESDVAWDALALPSSLSTLPPAAAKSAVRAMGLEVQDESVATMRMSLRSFRTARSEILGSLHAGSHWLEELRAHAGSHRKWLLRQRQIRISLAPLRQHARSRVRPPFKKRVWRGVRRKRKRSRAP